ncbi:MAG: hypothetical protein H6559_12465 [Lewinellaceae bacterium]|nr:hypothetical protein [Lewinellaceae bacterium]
MPAKVSVSRLRNQGGAPEIFPYPHVGGYQQVGGAPDEGFAGEFLQGFDAADAQGVDL